MLGKANQFATLKSTCFEFQKLQYVGFEMRKMKHFRNCIDRTLKINSII